MKRLSFRILAAVLVLGIPSLISAQKEDLRPYNPVADTIARAITAELPEWKHKSIPPTNPNGLDNFSHDVIIDQWSSEEGSVRIAVLLHSSEADAKKSFEEFRAGVKANEHLPDVDSEAHAWGINKSVALRIGSYAVYISSITLTQSDDGISDKRSKEEAKLSKMFAKIVVKALKGL